MKSPKKQNSLASKKQKVGKSTGKTTTLEIVVAEWKKNAKEVVRVMLQVYRGKNVFSIRAWYRDGDGHLRAGKNGINLRVAGHLRKLSKALRQARKLAKNFPETL